MAVSEEMVEALPCPFCGTKPVIQNGDGNATHPYSTIYCGNGECLGPKTTAAFLDDALFQWNVRAPAALSDQVVVPSDDGPYLVWSNQHRAWWRPNSRGYTDNVLSAGRYSRAEAMKISSHGRDGWIEPHKIPDEIAIAERDIPEAFRTPVPASTPVRSS